MNRIYKVIWSKVKNCYIVVSEIAKSHSKPVSTKLNAGKTVAAVFGCSGSLCWHDDQRYGGRSVLQCLMILAVVWRVWAIKIIAGLKGLDP